MSRTRLIRPAFFADELMAELSISTRLVYIGLWTLSDDAGYLESNQREIALALFGFESPRAREKRIAKAIEELVDLKDRSGKPEPRIVVLPCGDHLRIPTLPDHMTQGGAQVYTIRKRHETRCSVGLRTTPSGYVSVSVSDSSSDSESSDAQARGTKKKPGEVMLEAGGFAASLVKR